MTATRLGARTFKGAARLRFPRSLLFFHFDLDFGRVVMRFGR